MDIATTLPAAQPATTATPRLTAEIVTDLSAARTLWRSVEGAPEAVATPYQRFDWVAAFLAADPRRRPCLVVVRDEGGQPLALLPLAIGRERGFQVARFLGGRHANYHLPIYRSPAAAARLGGLQAILRDLGRTAGIDAYALDAQPLVWDGVASPLAQGGGAAASNGYGLSLDADPQVTVKRAFSADARKKLRTKERRLVALLGTVAHRHVSEPAEVARVLDALLAQKAARFAVLGVADPFADPAIQEALRAGCLGGPDAAPSLEVHALVGGDGRILATLVGAVDARRFSGMVNSFDADPEIARNSPGDLLLLHVVADQAARGRRGFDLGVGEARYKASLCDETIALLDVFLPVSPLGRLATAAMAGLAGVKRRLKRDPRFWTLYQRLRRLRAGRV